VPELFFSALINQSIHLKSTLKKETDAENIISLEELYKSSENLIPERNQYFSYQQNKNVIKVFSSEVK